MKSKIIGKKQLLVFALTCALGMAVFVNWYYTRSENEINNSPDVTQESNLGEAQYVGGTNVTDENDYFSSAKLNRTKAHDEGKEHLENIIADSSSDETAKAEARAKLLEFSETVKKETDIENLIKAQTGCECLVTLDSDSVEVVLPKGKVNDEVALKVKDIIVSKTDLSADSITVIELNK